MWMLTVVLLSALLMDASVTAALELVDETASASHRLPHIVTGNLNVSAYAGDTVTLPCEVEHLGSYHVNWLKVHNGAPLTLTVGYQQFSRNMRYRVAHAHSTRHLAASSDNAAAAAAAATASGAASVDGSGSNSVLSGSMMNGGAGRVQSWNFEIRKVVPEDEGVYECYIKLNGKHHKIKANIYLHVKNEKDIAAESPRSERLSSSPVEKIDMAPNSWIKLRCNTTGWSRSAGALSRTEKSASTAHVGGAHDLQWYKDGKLIEQDSRRLKKYASSFDNANYMELDLFAVDPDDSGVYQCKRDKTVLKHVMLQVVDGAGNGARCGGRAIERVATFVAASLTACAFLLHLTSSRRF